MKTDILKTPNIGVREGAALGLIAASFLLAGCDVKISSSEEQPSGLEGQNIPARVTMLKDIEGPLPETNEDGNSYVQVNYVFLNGQGQTRENLECGTRDGDRIIKTKWMADGGFPGASCVVSLRGGGDLADATQIGEELTIPTN